jgi:hypothetical protein
MRNFFKFQYSLLLFFCLYNTELYAQWSSSSFPSGNIYRSGNVGIGSGHNSPSALLHLYTNATSSTRQKLQHWEFIGNSNVQVDIFGDTHANRPGWLQFGGWGTDVGIGFVADEQAAVENGTSLNGFFLKNNGTGLLGIGTTNPTAMLHILSASTNALKLNSTAGSNVGIDFLTYATTSASARIARIQAVDMLDWNGSLAFLTKGDNVQNGGNAEERMRITHTGNVGIGTANPLVNLAVFGNKMVLGGNNLKGVFGAPESVLETQSASAGFVTVTSDIQVDGKANQIVLSSSAGLNRAGINISTLSGATSLPFVIAHGPKEQLRILPSGNVGIGSDNPSTLLHVKGNSSALFLDGTTVNNGATSKILFGYDGVSDFEISHPKYPGPAPRYLRIGSVTGTNRAIYMHHSTVPEANNKIIFSNSFQFSTGDLGPSYGGIKPGLSGAYIFDDQVSSTSLLVAPPTSILPYTIIPSGYAFSVHSGKSNFGGTVRVNTAHTLPDNAVTGMSMATATTGTSYSWIQTEAGKPLALNPIPNADPNNNVNTSYVAIGFTPGTYTVPNKFKLAVKGNIICEELRVQYAASWSDFVFDKSYKLKSLEEVESFIKENKHLPDVPSAEEVAKNGIESGKMDATLLQKIEELTLYMIEQKKQMDVQNAELKKLKEQNELLIQKLK